LVNKPVILNWLGKPRAGLHSDFSIQARPAAIHGMGGKGKPAPPSNNPWKHTDLCA